MVMILGMRFEIDGDDATLWDAGERVGFAVRTPHAVHFTPKARQFFDRHGHDVADVGAALSKAMGHVERKPLSWERAESWDAKHRDADGAWSELRRAEARFAEAVPVTWVRTPRETAEKVRE